MTHAVIKAAGISALLALGACAQTQAQLPIADPTPPPVGQTAPSPSPRAECAPAHATLYFGEQVASEEPVVTPLIDDFLARIRACEEAGGELRSLSILATADPGQTLAAARAQVRRRQDRVRDALVAMGAPADKILYADPVQASESAVMARRAELTADMY